MCVVGGGGVAWPATQRYCEIIMQQEQRDRDL